MTQMYSVRSAGLSLCLCFSLGDLIPLKIDGHVYARWQAQRTSSEQQAQCARSHTPASSSGLMTSSVPAAACDATEESVHMSRYPIKPI